MRQYKKQKKKKDIRLEQEHQENKKNAIKQYENTHKVTRMKKSEAVRRESEKTKAVRRQKESKKSTIKQ